MAVIRDLSSNMEKILYPGFLVGRDSRVSWPLRDLKVSSKHAEFRWRGVYWELRDLSSKNGTFINERRLGSGEGAPIQVGDRLTFGDGLERFEVMNVDPPEPTARSATGHTIHGHNGHLFIPDRQTANCIHVYTRGGQWYIRQGNRDNLASNSELVRFCGMEYCVILPVAWEPTLQPSAEQNRLPSISTIHLTFHLSQDVEYSELVMTHAGRESSLRWRRPFELLAALARARQADRHLADGAGRERGWVRAEELRRQFGRRLSDYGNRARQAFEEAGVIDPGNLIERRGHGLTRQMRLGVRQLTVRESGRS